MYVIIVGGGKVGTYLAELLVRGGGLVRLIEKDPEVATDLLQRMPSGAVIQGDGTDPLVLESAAVRQANVVAAVTGNDETNLVVGSLARFEFAAQRVIARVNDPANSWVFVPKMGIDIALNQADLLAHLIAEEMSLGEMMTLLKLRKGEYSLVEEKVHPDSAAAGRTIAELKLPAESAITAVIRKGELLVPRGDLVLQVNDEVLALVHFSRMAQLAGILGRAGREA
jgi:trk system potassium uptake protein TrkA